MVHSCYKFELDVHVSFTRMYTFKSKQHKNNESDYYQTEFTGTI